MGKPLILKDKNPPKRLQKFINTPIRRLPSRFRGSIENYLAWRAHVFAADDARVERYYLESLNQALEKAVQ